MKENLTLDQLLDNVHNAEIMILNNISVAAAIAHDISYLERKNRRPI